MKKNKEKGNWVYTFVSIIFILLIIAIITLININESDIKLENLIVINLLFKKDLIFKIIIIIWLIIISLKLNKITKK